MGSPYIAYSERRFGGRAYLEGTRITVDDIVSSYRIALDGLVINELLEKWFPDLTAEQIRAALEHYRDKPRETEARLHEDREVRRTHERMAI